MKKSICLIYTGGTIGMQRMPNGTLRPPDDPKDFLNVAPELRGVVDFDFVPLMNKDSTNVNPLDWTKMAQAVYERRDKGCQGFVIAHGTDTMHFSASAMAFALGGNLNFPVVFTGAQTIPAISHGDARVNLLRACQVATMDVAEVVICFGDYVFRGCRAQKKDEVRFDAFESPACFPLGYITEHILLSPMAKKRREDGTPIDFKPDFAQGVAQVSLIPGLEPELLRPILDAENCKGLILQSFGAGNVPNEEPYSLTELIRHAGKLNKPVLITSQFPANPTLYSAYAPGRDAQEAGAIPTGNMTSSCAVAKFRWVLAQVESEISAGTLSASGRVERVQDKIMEMVVGEMDEKHE